MNSPEFRLLAIWQSVVEMKNVRQKMLAYRKIALDVGITERNVRENIKKLVEQGYLVPNENWYALNLDCEFIKYVVKDAQSHGQDDVDFENQTVVAEPVFVYKTKAKYRIELDPETLDKFTETFGDDADLAIYFFKKEILKTQTQCNTKP